MEVSGGESETNINMPPEVALHNKPAVHMLILAVKCLRVLKVFAGLIHKLWMCSRVANFFSLVPQWCSWGWVQRHLEASLNTNRDECSLCFPLCMAV